MLGWNFLKNGMRLSRTNNYNSFWKSLRRTAQTLELEKQENKFQDKWAVIFNPNILKSIKTLFS